MSKQLWIQQLLHKLKKSSTQTHDMSFLTQLKESLKIPFKNMYYTLFILVISLPLLFTMIFFEMVLEESVRESFRLFTRTYSPSEFWYIPYYHIYEGLDNLTNVFNRKVMFLSLIYFIPLPLLEFLASYATIYLASKVYKNYPSRNNNSWVKPYKGFLVTSLIVMFLSTSLFLGFIWLFIALYDCNLISWYDIIMMVGYLAGLVIALPKYFEVNALWSLSLVVSTLGNIHGIDAFAVSLRFSKGKEKVGSYLMMVFFVWGFVLRVPCLFFDDGTIGIVGRTTLLWLGCLMKWVACVVYYYYCMGDALEKRMVDNGGGLGGGADVKASPRECLS